MAMGKKQSKIEEQPNATVGGIKIGQIGDYKPIPKFPKTCANC